jgi:chromosome segregation ATPase
LKQIEKAKQIKAQLDNTTMRRVMTALRTPNATFSAADAAQVLSLWNITSTTFLERAKLKNPVDRKIQELESAEEILGDKELELEAAMRMYQTAERKLQKARADRVLALQAEKRAREALARAKRNVAASKTQVNNTTKHLQQAELVYEKIALEREKMAQALAKQQEDVRKSVLSRKEVASVLKEEEEEPTLTDLEQLEQEEAELIAEYSRLEVTASQLQDKANRLREKAEKLNNKQ